MRPNPKSVSYPGTPRSSAVFMARSRTCSSVHDGLRLQMSASAPETCGAAMDVPAAYAYVSGSEFEPCFQVDQTWRGLRESRTASSPPGAANSTLPRLLYAAKRLSNV